MEAESPLLEVLTVMMGRSLACSNLSSNFDLCITSGFANTVEGIIRASNRERTLAKSKLYEWVFALEQALTGKI